MKKAIFLLLALWLYKQAISQSTAGSSGFQLQFQVKLTEPSKADSLAITWLLLPLIEGVPFENQVHYSYFPSTANDKGYFQQTIQLPDSVVGKTFGYRYRMNKGVYDFKRGFQLDANKTPTRTETWGYIDEELRVKPTTMLFYAPGSPNETSSFNQPYIGITTNGIAEKNLFPIKKTGYPTTPIENAVNRFLNTLSVEQKSASIFPVESNEWRRWHNIEDWPRAGICFEQMTATQKKLVLDFLKESLSANGFKKVKDIMTMEAYLATLAPDVKELGGEKYWFSFFGSPSDTEPWGWQMEGHHLVINYFILGDQVVMTPTFMGSEPSSIDTGVNKGLKTFDVEQRKGLDFFLSLDSAQRKFARLWHTKDYDFNRAEAFRDNEIIAKTGIPAKNLSKQQREALFQLIELYVNNIRDGQAKVKMEEVKSYLDQTTFTWVQDDDTNGPFYYRIHSPVILIEFDHQTPVFHVDPSKPFEGPVKSHIHTVVRTPNGNDYGKNLLGEHLEAHPHD